MSRAGIYVQVGDRQCWAVFDTEATDSFVVEDVAALCMRFPRSGALKVRPSCLLDCEVEGRHALMTPWVVAEIGADETGRRIQILAGRWAMSGAQIWVLPDGEGLDFSRYGSIIEEFTEVRV